MTNNIEGSAGLTAFQIGGEPSQLGEILSKDPSGTFYVLSCELQDMTNCTKAASGMVGYATGNFTSQFTTGSGMTPIGAGFMKKQPIYYVGLTSPKSLVTTEVQTARDQLVNLYYANKYYEQKSYQLVNGYPVPWDKTSYLYKNATALYSAAKKNVNILLDQDNTEIGVVDCWNTPDRCGDIADQINSQLAPIDLGFLSALQYAIPTGYVSIFLPSGDSISSWGLDI